MKKNKYFYEGFLDEKTSIVLYKAEHPMLDYEFIVSGYLHAASIVVDDLKNELERYKKLCNTQDDLGLPLLFLYIHSIEVALKYLIKHLDGHKGSCLCGFGFNKNLNEIESICNSHYLNELINVLDEILPKKGNLHYFKEYHEFKKIINAIYSYGVDSVSARYKANKDNKIYKVHERQVNLKVFALSEDVNKIWSSIFNYVNNKEFNDCENGVYTLHTKKELEASLNVLSSNRSLFEELVRKSEEINKNRSGIINFEDLSLEEITGTKKEKALLNHLETLSQDELSYLVMGLYTTRKIMKHSSLRQWPKRELIQKAHERYHLFDEAENKIKFYIDKIDLVLKNI